MSIDLFLAAFLAGIGTLGWACWLIYEHTPVGRWIDRALDWLPRSAV